uniref:THAP domain containing 7 n=1 Tax=Sphenodon punctatus TaxID=8508 RepID=A0A8D0GL67_SPHPU
MPRHCSAAGCCTRDTPETRNRGVSFHRLPKDNPRRAMWLENCRRKDLSGQGLWDPASKYVYFCSKHFEKSCFEMVGTSGYHRLKEGAVPTLFDSVAKVRRADKTGSGSSRSAKYPQRWRCIPDPENQEMAMKCIDVSCFPEEEESGPAAAPAAGEPHSQPSLPEVEPDGLSDSLLEQQPAATGQEEALPAPALPEGEPARPVSLSLYMLRLPPPAGAYIQNEHSYQVGSALLWKRRAEAALDALEKAQRQLQACRRREQRLRMRVCELQRERRPRSGDMQRQLKEHLQVFELQLLNELE